MRFQINTTPNGAFAYQFADDSNAVLFSSPSYPSLDDCLAAIRALIPIAASAGNYRFDGSAFEIVSDNQVLATSPTFANNADAQSAATFLHGTAFENTDFDVVFEQQRQLTTKVGFASKTDTYDFAKSSSSGVYGVETFQNEGNKQYYYHLNDASGSAFLYSQAYASGTSRDGGVRSILNNIGKDERVEYVIEGDVVYFIVKSQNNLEIARSKNYASQADAADGVAYARGFSSEFQDKYKKAEKKFEKDTSVSNQYQLSVASVSGESCFEALKNPATKLHYFHLNDIDSTALLFSQGYTSSKARDNGIVSVLKSLGYSDRIIRKTEGDAHYFVVKAGNKQEVARSRNFASAETMETQITWITEHLEACAAAFGVDLSEITKQTTDIQSFSIHIDKPVVEVVEETPAAVAVEPMPAKAERDADDYMICSQYARQDTATEHKGLYKFQHESGEYFFTWTNDEGDVLMRSEGYPTAAARDNGLESVAKNREIEARFKIEEVRGLHYVILKAGNHQEIARSCPYKDEAALLAAFPIFAPAEVAAAEPVAAEVAPVAMAAAAVVTAVDVVAAEPTVEEIVEEPIVELIEEVVEEIAPIVIDEPVIEVEEEKAEIPGVAVAAAVASVAAVTTNIEVEEETVVVPEPIVKEKVEIPAPSIEVVEKKAEKTIAKAVVPAPKPANRDLEDDYLACEEYLGKKINDKANNIALFKHDNGQYYFVMYNADGSVRLRSEGFSSGKKRDEELSGVLRNYKNKAMYKTIEKNGYVINVLKDKRGKEVGRSCMEKAATESSAIPVVVAATAAAAVISQVELPKVEIPAAVTTRVETPKVVVPKVDIPAAVVPEVAAASEGGFKLWWLLPLLLLPLLWFMCNKCKETPVVPKSEVKTEITTPATTTVTAEPAKTKLGVKSFLPVVLYFDNDQPDARTKATRTAKTYEQAYNAYYPLRNDFGAKGDGAATVNFFDTKVKKGMDDLQKLASALVEITKSGEKVNLTVKGFASPLAPNDYNQSLTGRRVSSIENYLSAYSGGILAKYIKDGSIKLSLTTQGEEKAKGGISDSAKDKKGSVYSVDASSERRVEITGIE